MSQPTSTTPNLTPTKYRGVAVTHVEVPLDQESLSRHFAGREAYRKTRYVVVENDWGTAVLRVIRADDTMEPVELFAPMADVELLSPPAQTARVVDPSVDTAVPSALARAAREQAPDARAVVVHGRYEHVSFIVDPAPLRLTVREVVPPWPPKLLDQAQRLLDVSESLPPIELVLDAVDLADLARGVPDSTYLLPCRGAGGTVDGPDGSGGAAIVRYLDERPPREDWSLIGCERSRQIHRWFYGADAPGVSFCPLDRPAAGGPMLTKCCLQDHELAQGPDWVSVPWGSTLAQVGEALALVADRMGAAWSAD